jgi:glyoxylase-like metal-dependent hydrolase (beta-lactamase superfamily II)
MTVWPSWVDHVLAPNPGPMTLEGTNTWVLGAAGGPRVVIDPGPADEDHLLDIVLGGDVALILLTHGHLDHSEGADRLHALTGAPVAAFDEQRLQHAEGLRDGDVLDEAGLRLEVLHTPGHSPDSLSFVARQGSESVVVTGDTILGRGSTLIDHPEGRLHDYFASLDRLHDLGEVLVLPGHGPVGHTSVQRASEILRHRRERLAQVRRARVDGAVTTIDIVRSVYPDLEPGLMLAAARNVEAQVEYLDLTETET